MTDSDPASMPADGPAEGPGKNNTGETDAPEAAEAAAEPVRDDAKRKRAKKKRPRQVLVDEDRLRELEEQSKKADEHYSDYLRARADLDNARKRMQRDKEEFVKYANERLLGEVIPILDNFERAFAAAEKVPATHNFAVGVEMILKQLREVLARYGVEELHPEGKPFDPAKHEAAESVETTEHPDHTVLDVLQRGYVLNGRVVQPAVVRVAVNPTAEAADASEAATDSESQSEDNADITDIKEEDDG
jgi:molecular chaperone GrpE